MIHQKLEHDAITVSNLARSWSISTQISYSCCKVANWGTPNLLQRMLNSGTWINGKNNNVYKTKRKETIHMLFSNLKSAKTYKSRRVVLSRKPVYSGISKLVLKLCFNILFMYYVFHCVLSHCISFFYSLSFLFIALERRCCPFKRFILIS